MLICVWYVQQFTQLPKCANERVKEASQQLQASKVSMPLSRFAVYPANLLSESCLALSCFQVVLYRTLLNYKLLGIVVKTIDWQQLLLLCLSGAKSPIRKPLRQRTPGISHSYQPRNVRPCQLLSYFTNAFLPLLAIDAPFSFEGEIFYRFSTCSSFNSLL